MKSRIPWNKGLKKENDPRMANMGFQKGNIPWLSGKKGIHLSPETEFKKGHVNLVRSPPKGVHYNPKDEFKKGCISPMKNPIIARRQGDSMIRKFDLKGRKETDKHYGFLYTKWKRAVEKHDNYECQLCHSKNNDIELVIRDGELVYRRVRIVAHHIKDWVAYPKERYNVENGTTLCKSCHNIITNHIGRIYGQ